MSSEDLSLQVRRLLQKWAGRLKLADWEIMVTVVPKSELPENKSGLCSSVLTKKAAHVKILHPDDADPNWINAYDMELTLVHELVHLHVAPWALLYESGDHSEILLEQAVHTLSTSLVEADRRSGTWAT